MFYNGKEMKPSEVVNLISSKYGVGNNKKYFVSDKETLSNIKIKFMEETIFYLKSIDSKLDTIITLLEQKDKPGAHAHNYNNE